jgi:hypothetical protein
MACRSKKERRLWADAASTIGTTANAEAKGAPMRALISTVIVILLTGFASTASAQTKNVKTQRVTITSPDVRVVKSKPHIFISYERMGKIAPLYTGESEKRVWLRFHNNSAWQAMFCSDVVPKDYGEAGVEYEVERYKGFRETTGTGLSDNCQYLLVKPGKSVLFSVPSEHLAEGLAIKVRYRYGWEVDPDGSDNELEPKHFVYFYSEDIPNQQVVKK